MPKIKKHASRILNSLISARAALSLVIVSVAAIYLLSLPVGLGNPVNAQDCGGCQPATCCDTECSLDCCHWNPYENYCMTECFICYPVCGYCCV